jgi:hypothetical protein
MYIKKVTPEVHAAVRKRDAEQIANSLVVRGLTSWEIGTWFVFNPICVAPLVDPSESANCWGRSTLDHIKDQATMSKRATSDEKHLVTLCEGHTENGARGGYQWNTAHRGDLREYLRRHYGVVDHPDDR